MSFKDSKYFAFILLTAASICWGFMYVFVRLMAEIDTLNIAFFRYIFALLAFAPFYFLSKQRKKINWRGRSGMALIIWILLNSALATVLNVLAIKHANASVASILINANPLFIALLAPILIKEKNRIVNYLGAVIAFGGVILVMTEGGHISKFLSSQFLYGYIFALVSAFSIGLSTIYLKKYLRLYGSWAISFYVFLIGAITLTIVNVLFGNLGQLFSISSLNWLWLILFGLVCTTFPFVVFNFGVEKIGPTKAGVFKLLIPVFAVVLAVLLLNEPLTWYIVVGGAVTIGGLALVQVK
ncbi:MAG: DMT family transporter [Parcubacteria group bacterium]|nr:DMT family transporter [Parcubacteria group bacterium]